MSSPSRAGVSKDGPRVVPIGQQPSGSVREQLERLCEAKHHNGAKCSAVHAGGTHSLGPEWGKQSRFTARGEVKRSWKVKHDEEA